jgi:hypothetical protein
VGHICPHRLWEFDENDRFFTTSCDLSMGNNLNCFFLHVSPEKRRKGWLLRKMSEVRINLDKMLNKDKLFIQIYKLDDFSRNETVKHFEPKYKFGQTGWY